MATPVTMPQLGETVVEGTITRWLKGEGEAAAEVALRGGTRMRDVLTVVEQVAASGGRAVVMTYYNPVLRYGVGAFALNWVVGHVASRLD